MTDSSATTWIEKARQDARSARRLLLDPSELETAAYHVQQEVEKAAKSLLTVRGIRYPRERGPGHDLGLLAKLIPVDEALRDQVQALADVTAWATAYRYPSDDPLTAEPLPTKRHIEIKLGAAETFVETVATRIAPSSPHPR